MKNANEFRIYDEEFHWVQSGSVKNDPYPCWWFCKENTALFCAIEVERNNRGVKLRSHSLTGGNKVIMLKPENGKFSEIDLEAFWSSNKLV